MEDEKTRKLFIEDMEGISDCSEEEMERLFSEGTKEAEARLLEGNMHRVYEAAKFFESDTIPLMDLVQEGSLALLLEIRNTEYFDEMTERRLDASVHEALTQYVAEETENEKIGEEIAVKLNVMDEVCVVLAEELGREATEEEVAKKMQMSVDEVHYLMKMALNALNKESE